MASNEIIQTVRNLLSQGDTGQALQLLIGLLEKDSRFRDNLLRTLRVAEVNYNAVRQQELKGILSFQEAQREYSKITDTLLAVMDDFEAGRVPATGLATSGSRQKWWAVGGAAILVLGALAFWLLRGRDAGCPIFENDKAFHVMVLPFDNLINEREAKPEVRIRNDIQELTKKAEILAEVKVNERNDMRGLNSQNAEQLGRKCKADLVIFGQYQAFEKDSIRVKMGYKFLKEGGAEFAGAFKTFRDITAVEPTRDLQDALFSLCAKIAMSEENWEFAKRWMSRIREKNAEEMATTDWLERQSK